MALSARLAIELALLLGFALVVARRGRDGAPSRARVAALGCIAVVSLLPYLQGVRVHPNGVFQVHPTEFYHYYLGTKYFAECGYYGLYEAATIAEVELDPESFRPAETLRHLRNPEFEVRKGDLLHKREAIRGRFTPARWQEFRDDYAYLRTFDLRNWGSSPPERDHGYNGTPVTTALLGGLASHAGLPADRFIPLAAWLDLMLILGTTALAGVALGWEVGFAFLILWALDPLNDYAFTGGAYLRHAYLVALAVGAILLARTRLFGAGLCLAAAAGLRVLPAAYAAAAVLRDGVAPGLWKNVRAHGALYAGGAVGVALLAAATWNVRAPDGTWAWQSFGERIERHAQNWSSNRVGLPFLLAYSTEHELASPAMQAGGPAGPRWRAATESTLHDRRFLRFALVAVGLAASLIFLRRATLAEAPFAGLFWLWLLAVPSHYDYAMLALVPLFFPGDRRTWIALAGLEAALLLLGASASVTRSPDRAYAAYTAAVGVFLVGVIAMSSMSRQTRAAPDDSASDDVAA